MRECPLPVPGPGQVRVKTLACGICATDLEMIAGWDRTGFPAVPGHEWAGLVDAAGPGTDATLVGQRCVAENVWQSDGGEVGFEHAGGYAEYFLTEAALVHRLPPDYPVHVAVLAEPLAVAMRGRIRLGNVRGQRVLVFGDGPIGLLMVLLLSRTGAADVSIVGGRGYRLDLAQAFGANGIINYHDIPDASTSVALAERLGDGFEVVVEASGSGVAAAAATELAAHDGRILIMGDYGKAVADFPWNRLLHRELTLTGSNSGGGGWKPAVKALGTWRSDLQKMITHKVAAADFQSGLALVRSRESHAVKVVMEWGVAD